MNTFMKTKITTLILLLLGLSSGKIQAKTYYHYTDAEGLTWTFTLDGNGGAVLDRGDNEEHCVSGPLIINNTITSNGQTNTHTIYTGDVLHIPAYVSDGTNTYPVRNISSFAFNYYFTAEKVILPSTLTGYSNYSYNENMGEGFFHTLIRRFVAEPGCQLHELGNLAFAYNFLIFLKRQKVYFIMISQNVL